MAKKNVIIIGNGFDLAHNLKTDYSSFIEDIRKDNNRPEGDKIYNNILGDQKSNGFLSILLRHYKKGNWSDIESTYFDFLRNYYDKDFFKDKFSEIFYYSTAKELNDEFNQIKQCLKIYLLKEQDKFNKISGYDNFFSQFDKNNTLVLNFNYTNTVKQYTKKLLNVNCIHIHGELENDNMIFGFSAADQEYFYLLNKNDNELLKNIKRKQYEFSNKIDELDAFIKDDDYSIFILGHSCGISDREILNKIFTTKSVSIISTFFYTKQEFGNTSVNIERIIDNESNGENKVIFDKFLKFRDSCKMLQFDSTTIEEEDFKKGASSLEAKGYSVIEDKKPGGLHFI